MEKKKVLTSDVKVMSNPSIKIEDIKKSRNIKSIPVIDTVTGETTTFGKYLETSR